jgi:hypothetical protein
VAKGMEFKIICKTVVLALEDWEPDQVCIIYIKKETEKLFRTCATKSTLEPYDATRSDIIRFIHALQERLVLNLQSGGVLFGRQKSDTILFLKALLFLESLATN